MGCNARCHYCYEDGVQKTISFTTIKILDRAITSFVELKDLKNISGQPCSQTTSKTAR
jgi:sulfatase maturation enzyme AslB (radical SAM superfamily)